MLCVHVEKGYSESDVTRKDVGMGDALWVN